MRFLLLILIWMCLSCQQRIGSTEADSKACINTVRLSKSVDSCYRSYLNRIRRIGVSDSLGYELLIESYNVDSTTYVFNTYSSIEQISYGRIIIGVTHVDSIPVIISIRAGSLLTNTDTANKVYLKFIGNKVPLRKDSFINDVPTQACTIGKSGKIRIGPAPFLNLVPKSSNISYPDR